MIVKVSIEETLCRTVEYEFPEGTNIDEAMEKAEDMAREQYRSEEIVLDASDYAGTLHSVECDGYVTEWKEF